VTAPFEFENWAVIALGGIPNKTQVGDMGIDGRIFPVAAAPKKVGAGKGETPAFVEFLDHWYPIQVKQKDKVGRPDIDSFEAVMTREDRTKGFFVAFDYTSDALREIDAFFRKSAKVNVALSDPSVPIRRSPFGCRSCPCRTARRHDTRSRWRSA